MQPFTHKGRVSKVIINEIWVRADFPKLHQAVEALDEAESRALVFGHARDELIVQEFLASRELTSQHLLSLFGKLGLDLAFQSGGYLFCVYF